MSRRKRPPYAERCVGERRERKVERDRERRSDYRAQRLALAVLAEALRPFLFPTKESNR